ncbi:copper response regulator transcription factor CrdR [Helicobacter cynogastricus]|uniref:copper response regulator transcription factor CrdR n=1 Tax=Helicobacter cynogastricus TaxID=329937 RepID=UPI0013152D43|nr:copper response regulator transcription factor CrdR [Helicobacter cynogastricus]
MGKYISFDKGIQTLKKAHKERLFLLEDDVPLHAVIVDFLTRVGFEVQGAYESTQALSILSCESFNLLLLDVQVPGINSFETLQALRQSHITTPTIFISVLSDMASLKKAFDLGASDYLKKPFDLEELQIRIERLLIAQKIQIGAHGFYESGVLNVCGQSFFLTSKEKQLLEFFLRNQNRILSSDQIIANVWNYESGVDDSTLRTYIKNLRKLLGKEIIQNVKGLGYCFKN